MAAEPELKIPVLTEAVDTVAVDAAETAADYRNEPYADESVDAVAVAARLEPRDRPSDPSRDELIAELQTEIAASTFALTDEIMRAAFAEMEATIFEQIAGRLRRELPEMIDDLLRERLDDESDY